MANNFRLSGYCYVSKEGNDANSGLTPDLPKLTLQAGMNLLTATGRTLVVGAGVYKEAIAKSGVSLGTINIIADGAVVFEATSPFDIFQLIHATSSIINFQGIEFRGYLYIEHINANAFATFTNFTSCILKCDVSHSSNGAIGGCFTFTKCLLLNSTLRYNIGTSGTLVNPSGLNYSGNILINYQQLTINTSSGATPVFVNNYMDSSSMFNISSSITAANFNFNNIQGKIIMNTGTYSGIALSFADHRTYYPTFNVQSISADPLFNNAQNLDFTLQAASPHIRAASDYISNIGGTEYAKHYDANATEFTSGATITNLTLQGDNSYTITAPNTEGRIITAPLAVQSYPATKPLTGIIWNGSLEFNKSVTAGTQGNQNVPAYDTYTTGAGASPDRLKIKMRYSTQSASPTAGQWDNGGYWAVDTYQLVEINVKPKVDSNGIGNGDPTYIEFVGLGDIVPTWIQLDIKLRNDYNP